MDSHPLVELAHMLHRVCSIVVNGEGWLLEPSREYDPFYVVRERRLGELVQCLAHGVVSQTPRRWASVPTPPVMFFFVGEGLAWGSPRSSPIVVVIFIIGGCVKSGMRLPLLCMVQLSFQIVYLSLHGLPIVLFLRHMAPDFLLLRGPTIISSLKHVDARVRVALTGLGSVYTSLSKPSILFVSAALGVEEATLLLGFGWFELMGACLMRA